VRLVVIDPVSAYLRDADSHKNAEIRALLVSSAIWPLGIALPLSRPLISLSGCNKRLCTGDGKPRLCRAARAAYPVVSDQKDRQRRLFLPFKNNVGRDVIGYAFTIETVPLADNIETSRILGEQEAVTITADEAMTHQQTVNRCLTVIKHMFQKAVEWGMIKTNPATGLTRYL
jgi:hypothetical protein